MPLDPATASILQALAAMDAPAMSSGTPEIARKAFRTLTVDARPEQWKVPVGDVTDVEIPGPVGPIRARVYRPLRTHDAQPSAYPTVLFIHGGGHVIGDLETHDNSARTICRDVDAVVVSIDYRLAPESPWPAAPDDCFAASEWVFDHVAELGGNPSRVGVAGDSAGANLAAVTALRSRDVGRDFTAQLLLYPVVDFQAELESYPSRVEFQEGYFLTLDDMVWFGQHYAGEVDDLSHPHLSPMHADLAGMPTAVVATAEFDPLRDEGEAFAAALVEAGVEVVQIRFGGLIHGFFDLGPLSPASAKAVTTCCKAFASLMQ
ncbi:MAG: alpha/beta hydrolase [Candidatus Nanopelagicales bacterium]|nr:alpha/beta hydrolase [Candidatus Nanopelagicales bacterium]